MQHSTHRIASINGARKQHLFLLFVPHNSSFVQREITQAGKPQQNAEEEEEEERALIMNMLCSPTEGDITRSNSFICKAKVKMNNWALAVGCRCCHLQLALRSKLANNTNTSPIRVPS